MTTRNEEAWKTFRALFKEHEADYYSARRADRLTRIAARRVFGPERCDDKPCEIEHSVVALLANRRLTATELYDKCSEISNFKFTYSEFKELLRTLVGKKHIAVPPPSVLKEDDVLLTATVDGGQEAYLSGGEGIPKGCLLAHAFDSQPPV